MPTFKIPIELPAGEQCGPCRFPKWEGNPNGFAWVCPVFEFTLSPRVWMNEKRAYKHERDRDVSLLRKCEACIKATKKKGRA